MRSLVSFLLLVGTCSAFVAPIHRRVSAGVGNSAVAALPTPEESAKALTDYMAKAHEEKIRAMESVEAKFKDRITELEAKVHELEGANPTIHGGVKTESNTYLFPATNRDLLEKVQAYKTFLSDYTVRVQEEKVQAVATAEQKMKDKYEAIIADLKKE